MQVKSSQIQCVEQEQPPGEGGMSSSQACSGHCQSDMGQQRLGPLTEPAQLLTSQHGYRLRELKATTCTHGTDNGIWRPDEMEGWFMVG